MGETAATERPRIPRLGALDMSLRLDKAAFDRQLGKLQTKLMRIQQSYLANGHSAVIVFEGWDAAGKGGTIRRISSALDPRSFKVWPIGPPRRYYLARHYLTRFMERLPPEGAITVFDRSWYGRVLVERVEELTPKEHWERAYEEINTFEKMLVDDGTRVVKIFMHITPEEQLERFRRRMHDPLKRWKLSSEDFRNRRHWSEYHDAIDDMFEKTSTAHAPWCVIPANSKRYARIAAIREIAERLGHGVDLAPPTPDAAVLEEARTHFELPDQLARELDGETG